jgi:hypothetical protein
MDSEPPAVPFSRWLDDMQAALAEKRPADVPCGECNACCRTSHFVHVRAEERRALRHIPPRLLFPAPHLPPGTMVMGYDETGCCPMLVCSRCSIYEDRPIACRTYDCRIYAATGVPADRPAIAEWVERWRFTYPTADDRRLHAAVQAAARFIGDPLTSPVSVNARGEPVRVAVLAVATLKEFLHEVCDERRRAPTDRDRSLAILAADEELFGDG